jgi:exonuclease 3'-5' domain-containing protein 1
MEKFLAEVLDPVLKDLKPGDLQFFCDMEGNNLGRDGTISLLQITIRSLNKTWIFDVTVLKEVVFGTNSPAGNSIRRVLECQEVQTAWFDCRGDGNALMFKAQVRMQNVFDMSLLELTVRQNDFYKEYRWGLDKSIGRLPKSVISFEEYAEWHKIKNAGKSLCRQHGYQLFDKRPLVDVLKAYAGQDTIYMPHIYDMYMKRLEKSDFTYQQILDESRNAIDLACSESFNPNDRNNSKAPYPFRVYRDTYADYY